MMLLPMALWSMEDSRNKLGAAGGSSGRPRRIADFGAKRAPARPSLPAGYQKVSDQFHKMIKLRQLITERDRWKSRTTVLRRSEQIRFSSASDDEVGGFRARCANVQSKAIGSQR